MLKWILDLLTFWLIQQKHWLLIRYLYTVSWEKHDELSLSNRWSIELFFSEGQNIEIEAKIFK